MAHKPPKPAKSETDHRNDAHRASTWDAVKQHGLGHFKKHGVHLGDKLKKHASDELAKRRRATDVKIARDVISGKRKHGDSRDANI